MGIAYMLDKNPLHPGRLRALVLRQRMTMDEFLAFCQNSSTLTPADVKAVLDRMYAWVVNSAMLGKEADFGDLGRMRLGIKAQISGFGEKLDRSKTELTVNWQVSPRLKREVAGMAKSKDFEYVRYTRPVPHPQIRSVVDQNLRTADVYAVGHVLRITGENLKFDPDQEDEGVFFKLPGGSEIRAVEYSYVARRTVSLRVPDGVSGAVDVLIRNRGWSKRETKPREGEHETTLQPAE